ncbi:MAG: hypothetical protein JJ855_08625 [Rhodospirillales bacterium]|nr:hypothetical protein [Rhodospirillales bacterium]
MRNQESTRSSETRWVTIAVVGIVGLLLAYNVVGFVIERPGAASFQTPPHATHRAGYMSFVESSQNHQYDFRLYEALRRHFDGAELIGYDENAVSFGGYGQLAKQFGRRTFAGFESETVSIYDPMLASDEALKLRQEAVEVLPATEHLPAVVVVAPQGLDRLPASVLVLQGVDGTRFYVSASMVPERYKGVTGGD